MGFQGTTYPPRPRRCRRRGRPSSAPCTAFRPAHASRTFEPTPRTLVRNAFFSLERLRQPLPVDALGSYQTRPRYPGAEDERGSDARRQFRPYSLERLLQVLGQRHQTLGHRGQVVSESKLVTVLNDALATERTCMPKFWRYTGVPRPGGPSLGYHGAHRAFLSTTRA
jgi:hypothetical protein